MGHSINDIGVGFDDQGVGFDDQGVGFEGAIQKKGELEFGIQIQTFFNLCQSVVIEGDTPTELNGFLNASLMIGNVSMTVWQLLYRHNIRTDGDRRLFFERLTGEGNKSPHILEVDQRALSLAEKRRHNPLMPVEKVVQKLPSIRSQVEREDFSGRCGDGGVTVLVPTFSSWVGGDGRGGYAFCTDDDRDPYIEYIAESIEEGTAGIEGSVTLVVSCCHGTERKRNLWTDAAVQRGIDIVFLPVNIHIDQEGDPIPPNKSGNRAYDTPGETRTAAIEFIRAMAELYPEDLRWQNYVFTMDDDSKVCRKGDITRMVRAMEGSSVAFMGANVRSVTSLEAPILPPVEPELVVELAPDLIVDDQLDLFTMLTAGSTPLGVKGAGTLIHPELLRIIVKEVGTIAPSCIRGSGEDLIIKLMATGTACVNVLVDDQMRVDTERRPNKPSIFKQKCTWSWDHVQLTDAFEAAGYLDHVNGVVVRVPDPSNERWIDYTINPVNLELDEGSRALYYDPEWLLKGIGYLKDFLLENNIIELSLEELDFVKEIERRLKVIVQMIDEGVEGKVVQSGYCPQERPDEDDPRSGLLACAGQVVGNIRGYLASLEEGGESKVQILIPRSHVGRNVRSEESKSTVPSTVSVGRSRRRSRNGRAA